MGMVNRFDIYVVTLDPTQGSEIKKTRPCVVVSPDEMNVLNTVIVAPMTTKGMNLPTRVSLVFQEKKGQIVLDQIRTIDKRRLSKKIGTLNTPTSKKILSVLQEMFAA
jgi:mRNA interferase MazF